MLYARVNVPTELSLAAAGRYGEPSELAVDVIFSGAGGEWRVPAFWAGGNTFRVRFAPPAPGRYHYQVISRPEDAGLHGQVGELEAVPYEGQCELYRHGRLRVAASRRTLEHADGTPFFWLGDTWWMGLTRRLDWPQGFRHLAADRAAKGFNLVQIVAGPLPDFDAQTATWDPQQANEAGWPWEEGWQRLNPAFYDLADLRLAALVESGLVPCIVGMWGYYLPFMGVERVKQHWRNLVARYGAYPVIWCLAGEVNMPTYSHFGDADRRAADKEAQEQGWTEVARSVRDLDPFHNPISAHPSHPDSRAMLRDETLLDVDMLQTGHGSYASLRPSVETVCACLAKEPPMPVVNSEVCYEGIMGGSQQEVQRFLFWTSITCGSAGHTYGAQGIWAMSSRDEPFKGTTGSWGDGFWQDVMHLPGSAQVGLGRRFLERYPWWRFAPRREPEVEQAGRKWTFATGIPGAVAVCYLAANCMEGDFRGVQGTSLRLEPGARYRAFFLNPRTGAEVKAAAVKLDAEGKWPAPPKPTMEDWVLVLEDPEALAKVGR